jgi:site-specific DNA-cytosine methylase
MRISIAGSGAGLDGEYSGLWREMARIIGEVRPRYAYVENSPMLITRGFDRVLCDLAAMGFDAEWGVVGAHHAGAPHKRDRIWILAHHQRNGREGALRCWSHRTSWSEEMWPTPTVNGNNRAGLTAKSGDGLATAVKRFATPAASDAIRGGTCITENMTGQSLRQQIGGRLNPEFVEWLMGWPIGSTAFSPLATDKFREWWLWHGEPSNNKG